MHKVSRETVSDWFNQNSEFFLCLVDVVFCAHPESDQSKSFPNKLMNCMHALFCNYYF